ncbi:MAG: hypothetical protein D6710_01780 [Nitrospirae bacterium]|nr:MAG: hypothetical protein D6710_01780 [Nitrospirota bacterium]
MLLSTAILALLPQAQISPPRVRINYTLGTPIPTLTQSSTLVGNGGSPGAILYTPPPANSYPAYDAIPDGPPYWGDLDQNGKYDYADRFEEALAAGKVTEIRVPAFPYPEDVYADYPQKKNPWRIYFSHLTSAVFMGASDENVQGESLEFRPRLRIDVDILCPAPGRMADIPPEYYPVIGDWMRVVSWGYMGFSFSPMHVSTYDGVWDYTGASGKRYRWFSEDPHLADPWHLWDLSGDGTGGENLVCPDPCDVRGYGTIFPLDCTVAWGQHSIQAGQVDYVSHPEADGRVTMYIWARYSDETPELGGNRIYPSDHNPQAMATIASIGAVGYEYQSRPNWPQDSTAVWRCAWIDFETGNVILDHVVPGPTGCLE